MTVKYKVSDFAKDLNLSAKKVLDELAAMGSTGKKNSSNLEENELNYLLEKFSKDNSVANLDEFLNSAKAAKEEPKPTEKKAEKKAEKKPEAPKAEKMCIRDRCTRCVWLSWRTARWLRWAFSSRAVWAWTRARTCSPW